jgi:hypothetical protein
MSLWVRKEEVEELMCLCSDITWHQNTGYTVYCEAASGKCRIQHPYIIIHYKHQYTTIRAAPDNLTQIEHLVSVSPSSGGCRSWHSYLLVLLDTNPGHAHRLVLLDTNPGLLIS